jgi:hypothetical protein
MVFISPSSTENVNIVKLNTFIWFESGLQMSVNFNNIGHFILKKLTKVFK